MKLQLLQCLLLVFIIILLSKRAYQEPICIPKSEEYRFDCHPDKNASAERCAARKCCWANPLSGSFHRGPNCYFPQDYPQYAVTFANQIAGGMQYRLSKSESMFTFPDEITTLDVQIIDFDINTVRIRITDAEKSRFEVPYVLTRERQNVTDKSYRTEINYNPFSIKVIRSINGKTLFDSSVSPLIYADQFIQFATILPGDYVYGLGQHRTQFQISTNWRKMAFWTRDQATVRDDNLYGVHPFLLGFDTNNDAYGYFMLNSNAMEVRLQPYPAITYRTIGGIIDFFIFTGPLPTDVIKQYWMLISPPVFPPYWTLGFHLSRWNYGTLNDLKQIVNEMKAANFPYDTQWTDIDYLDKKRIFTYDKVNWAGFPEFVQNLHKENKMYMSINDPGISCDASFGPYITYDRGIENNVYVRWPNGSGYLVGEVWPGITVYPDFTHPNATKWWAKELIEFNKIIAVDGLWIDMNEVSNFVFGSIHGCEKSKWNDPWFVPEIFESYLYAKTLCPTALHHISNHYNLHSLYGFTEAMVTYEAFQQLHPNKRPYIMTRSSFSGSGRYTTNWGGDNFATFEDMYYSITDIMNFNMFGFAMTGDDICGFIFNTTVELCTRWFQLGAFYPFMRNHNNDESIRHDPAAFDANTRRIMKNALILRYRMLPFLYTLLYEAHSSFETVVQPLFFAFPSDKITHKIDAQFLIGGAVMVAPVLGQGETAVSAYFPDDDWYEFPTGNFISNLTIPGWNTLSAPIDKVNIFIKAGHVIPMHIITDENKNAIEGRNSKFKFLVTLKANSLSHGSLFWDDGETNLTMNQYNYFRMDGNEHALYINRVTNNYHTDMILDELTIAGTKSITEMFVANTSVPFTYDSVTKTAHANNLNLNLLNKRITVITWK